MDSWYTLTDFREDVDSVDRMKESEANSQRTYMHCIAHEHQQQRGEGQREGRAGSGW